MARTAKKMCESAWPNAMEVRRRVKEQLKNWAVWFFDVNFSYIDNETLEEFLWAYRNRAAAEELIPAGIPKPGVVHLVTQAESGMTGVCIVWNADDDCQ